jgi:hypothetical protein
VHLLVAVDVAMALTQESSVSLKKHLLANLFQQCFAKNLIVMWRIVSCTCQRGMSACIM